MDITHVSSSTPETVVELTELIDKAHSTTVEEVYLAQANKLSEQLNGNLKARDILKMLQDYPPREYPEPEPLDAKGKPIKQSSKDAKDKKPTKKKKEPPFPMPDWAVELEAVQQQVK